MRHCHSLETEKSFYSTDSFTSYYETDVIVIGAGLAGLTAAYRLCQRDASLRLIILEAKDRVGGRTFTVPIKTAEEETDQFDLGGQWVSSAQNHIISLLEELNLETYPQYGLGYKMGQAGTPIWQKFTSFPVFGPWYCRYELYQFILKIERMVKKSTLHDPMSCSFANELDSITMETLLCRHLSTVAARDIMRALIRVTFGTEPCEMSALYFMAYSNGTCGFLNQFKSSKAGARELRIKGGAQQISELMVDKICKEFIFLGDPVVRVDQVEDRVYVTALSNKLYRCEYLIMAIPPCEVNKVRFYPPLPILHRRLLQRFPIGHLTKFVVTYPRPFWRENGYSGEVLSYGGAKEQGCDTGPISVTYDATTYHGSPALMGYFASKVGIQWSEKDADCRRRSVLETLSKFWGSWALEPLDYVEKNWSDEDYVGGCPIHVTTPGMMPRFHYLRTPFIRIHWAGTETATHWCGYMNGAIQSGHRAAIEVLYELRPQVLTAADLEDIEKDLMRQTPVAHSVPLKYRWKIWLPVVLIGFLYAAYSLRSWFWFSGTGRID